MVFNIRRYKHLFEVYIKCPPKTNHPYNRTVRLRVNMVPIPLVPRNRYSLAQTQYTRPQEWYPLSLPRYYWDHITPGHFPACRPHS